MIIFGDRVNFLQKETISFLKNVTMVKKISFIKCEIITCCFVAFLSDLSNFFFIVNIKK